MTSPESSTRERLLAAAMDLFARKGYASTSIADIQRACGLSPGSGALYKHFSSKRALLQEATRLQIERMGARSEDYDRTRPTDIRGALRLGAEQVWASFEHDAQLLRVMFREHEAVEDVVDDLWSAATIAGFQLCGRALHASTKAGVAQAEDAEATATVLVAALAYLPVAQLLVGRTPGDIDRERFLEAWLRLAEAVFTGAAPT